MSLKCLSEVYNTDEGRDYGHAQRSQHAHTHSYTQQRADAGRTNGKLEAASGWRDVTATRAVSKQCDVLTTARAEKAGESNTMSYTLKDHAPPKLHTELLLKSQRFHNYMLCKR